MSRPAVIVRLLTALGLFGLVASASLWALSGSPAPQAGAAGCVLFICPPTTTTTTVPPPSTTVPPATTTTVPATTTTVPGGTATTVPTTTGSGSGSGSARGSGAFVPCTPAAPGGDCQATPTDVSYTYPASSSGSLSAVMLRWVPGSDRPAAAPQPGASSAVLSTASSVTCPSGVSTPTGDVSRCWAWPLSMTDSAPSGRWVLNGTYQLTGCSSASDCAGTGIGTPTSVGLAVLPAAPRDFKLSASNGAVTASWTSSADPEPDLVGYALTRDGDEVYVCHTSAALTAGSPCSGDFTAQDHPPTGTWTYSVRALRLGVTPIATDLVASAAASSPSSQVYAVASTGAVTSDPFGVTGSVAGLPPIASLSTAVTVPPELPTATTVPDPGDSPALGDPGVSGSSYNPNLPYSKQGGSQSLAVGDRENGPSSSHDVVPLGVLALAILALALAAHVYYVRSALDVATAKARHLRSRTAPGGA